MRACMKCGEVKPLEAFPPVRRGEPKLQTWCRECFAEANARNYRKNHEREKARLVRQVAEKRAGIQQQLTEYLWYTRNRKRQIAKARIRRDHHAAQLRSWVRA